MDNKRRHHKQPQLYLKGFVAKDDNHPNTPSIWIYKKGEELPKRKGIRNTAFTKDFYAFIEEDGSINYNKYEDLLMKDFEQPADSILKNLRQFESIDEEEKKVFAKYVASMITRGEYGKGISEYSMELAKEQQLNANPNLPKPVIEEFEKQISELKTKGEIFREQIISKALLIKSYVEKMNWTLYTTTEKLEYFTSDNPVFSSQLSKKEGELIFPISSKLTLYASWQKNNDRIYERATNKVVETVRDIVAKIAIREVYFSQRRNWVVKFVNNR